MPVAYEKIAARNVDRLAALSDGLFAAHADRAMVEQRRVNDLKTWRPPWSLLPSFETPIFGRLLRMRAESGALPAN
jgi:hypothetical protein